MRRPRCADSPWRPDQRWPLTLPLLLGALLTPAAAAQDTGVRDTAPSAPAGAPTLSPAAPAPAALSSVTLPDAQVCAQEPVFVDITVNGEGRGGALILAPPNAGIWVNPSVLRPAEAGYVARTVACAAGRFALLRPALSVTYDPAELTLEVRPALDLLPGGTLDFGAGSPGSETVGEVLPVFTVGASGLVQRDPFAGGALTGTGGSFADTLSHAASLRLGYQNARVQASVQASEAGTAGAQTFGLEGGATYSVSRALDVGAAAFVLRDSGGTWGLSPYQVSGLLVQAGSARAYRLPLLSVPLPLDTDVTVTANGGLLRQFRASAGLLTLRNIPLSAPSGTIELTLRDGTGSRVRQVQYTAADVTVAARSLAAVGRLGAAGSAVQPGAAVLAAALTGVYGLSDRWSAAADLFTTSEIQALQASLRYNDAQLNAGFSARLDTRLANPLVLSGDAAYTRANWRYGAALSVPPANLSAALLSAQVSLVQARSSATLGLQAAPGTGGYGASLGGSVQVSNTLSVGAEGALFTGARTGAGGPGWRVGVTLNWNPTPKLNVQSAAQVGSGLGGSSVSTDSSLQAVSLTQVSYQPDRTNTFTGAAALQTGAAPVAALRYDYSGNVLASVGADTRGAFSVSGSAAAAWVAGRLYVAQDSQGRGLLVHTGVPGVTLLVGGQTITADGRGDALVLLGSGVDSVTLSPDYDRLPITVSVTEDQRQVALPLHGVVTLDWTGNFIQSQWVRLLHPDGTPLRYGHFTLDAGAGTEAVTDDDGWSLIPKPKAPLTVQVREEGSATSCSVTLQAGQETYRCGAP